MLAPWKKSYDEPRHHIRKQKHYFADRGPSSQSYGFSSSYVWMCESDHEESWVLKNWCFWTAVLEKTPESPLGCKKIPPLHPKGKQSWISLGMIWWSWSFDTLATWCEELTHWERPWCWEKLKMRGEADKGGWDGWMASLPRWPSLSRLWDLVMDREAWLAANHGSQTQTRLSDRTELTDMYN